MFGDTLQRTEEGYSVPTRIGGVAALAQHRSENPEPETNCGGCLSAPHCKDPPPPSPWGAVIAGEQQQQQQNPNSGYSLEQSAQSNPLAEQTHTGRTRRDKGRT
ncbi:uncharacterized protein V6R79_024759 [Siganus canaliculatus]